MGISKVILNGVVKVDLTQDTVEESNLLSGYTATGADGEAVEGAIASKTSADLTVSGATVTAPAGFYSAAASKSVTSGTAGTPTATKGTVSNHSVSVTPSVTNTTGYITGGTKNGTAVTVSVSELESGTKTITENGTGISVSGYSMVNVDVPSGESVTVNPLNVTQNGTYTAPTGTAYSPVTVAVEGESSSEEEKDVNFYDYDGTVLHSYTASEFAQLSALPANPTHTGLTAQGWNWSLANAKNYVAKYGKLNVGQMYITTSGATEIDVTFAEPYLHPYILLGVNGTVIIDWGDNTPTTTLTGTALNSSKYADHVYASAGDYTVKLTASNGQFQIYGTTNSTSLFKEDPSANRFYPYNNGITSIRIGANCLVGSYAFYGLRFLTLITIPNGVTSIGYYAFQYCRSLKSITIPDGITIVDNHVLDGCSSLESVTIPNGVTSIGSYALYNCMPLRLITIPEGVTSIGSYAFQNCYALRLITIPDGVTSIGGSAFHSCYALRLITIPDGVTSIGSNAFYGCRALRSITIPDGVTSIGSSTFAECDTIISIAIPDGITSIGGSAFSGCSSIKSITIPDGVTSIESNTFSACTSIASMTIPEGVTSIKTNAFSNCYIMKEIHFLPTTPPTLANSNAFNSVPYSCVFYVPAASLDAYKAATNWSYYANQMVGE